MINKNDIVRGGKGYAITEGRNEAGKSRCFIQDAALHPVHEQPIRRAPVKIEIFLDDVNLQGEVTAIFTTWKTALLSNGQKAIPETGYTEYMKSSDPNRDEFVSQFLDALKFIINGYVRAELGGNKTGYNELPAYVPQPEFAADGTTVIGYKLVLAQYTPEQEAEPANNHYYYPPQPEPTEPNEPE